MRTRMSLWLIVVVALAAPSFAATRVFVSTTGTDSGSCPITAPCRTFAYAYTQVSPGGEIIAKDTGGYGPVTIGQSVTIVAAPGATAFVAASSTGITVSAGSSDTVTLRGLAITAQGGTVGVQFLGGKTLNVENCLFHGFTGPGAVAVSFSRTGDTSNPQLNLIGTTIRGSGVGVYASDYGPGSPAGGPPPNIVYVTIAGSTLAANAYGVIAADNARVTIADTVITMSSAQGVAASAGNDYSVPEVNLERCTISRNAVGVHCGGPLANTDQTLRGLVRLANCTIAANDAGIEPTADGIILSRLSGSVVTNTIAGNVVDGTPTSTYAAK